jgi:hypothetical protein
METKICGVCGKEKPLDKFSKTWGKEITRNTCKACYCAEWRAQLKVRLFDAFGWRCSCCGESHPHFFTLEHVGGYKKPRCSQNYEQMIRDAEKDGFDPTKYRLLCLNCNHAKGRYGRCPHEVGYGVEQAVSDLKKLAAGTGVAFVKRNLATLFQPGHAPGVHAGTGVRKGESSVEAAVRLLKASGITLEELSRCLPRPAVE